MSQWKQTTPEGVELIGERIRAIAERYLAIAETMRESNVDSFRSRGFDTVDHYCEKLEANVRSNTGYLEKEVTERKYSIDSLPKIPGVHLITRAELAVAEERANYDEQQSKQGPPKKRSKPPKKTVKSRSADVESTEENQKRKSG